jgi:prepilin-type N-terminal cleavage/methylation domain-containing protein
MKTIFYQWKKLIFPSKKKKTNQGFTLTELLVAILMSSIIIIPLLALMFGLLQDNQKEMAFSETQQEMKRALNYISNELKEAVFVYNGTQLDGLVNYLPNFDANTTTPILAFWKVDPVPYNQNDSIPDDCNSNKVNSVNDGVVNSPRDRAECANLRIERRSYTLVVYLQSTDNTAGNWKGKSRILRYQLRKFSDMKNLTGNNADILTRHTGYVDPRSESNFVNWPKDLEQVNLQNARPVIITTNPPNLATLVDFVDLPTNDPTTNLPTCQTDYVRSPSSADFKSFFACVRNPLVGQSNFNQDVFLYLRGNSEGKYGEGGTASLPTLQTQVLVKGVIEKTVD